MRQPARIDSIERLFQQYQADPHPMYRQLRAAGPVLLDADGKCIVLGYADARAVLSDSRISVDPRASGRYQQLAEAGEISDEEQRADENPLFIELDPPQHTRLRLLVSQAFASR